MLEKKRVGFGIGTNEGGGIVYAARICPAVNCGSASERGITTIYSYTHGLMSSTDYSDTTPDGTIHHEPLGRRQNISTSVAKSEFIYEPVTLDIDMEANQGSLS
jgi:hypothetical protein